MQSSQDGPIPAAVASQSAWDNRRPSSGPTPPATATRCRRQTCMVNPFSVTSSGRPTVLVDDPAEAIAALHRLVDDSGEAIAALHRSSWQWDHLGRFTGPPLLDPLVRSSPVVVVDELHQHALSRSRRPKDEHPI